MEEVKELYKFTAKKENEFNSLTKTNENFVPCELIIEEESAKIIYDLENLKDINSIKSRNLLDKLNLLINIAKLYTLTEDYYFNLNPNNLFYDYNLELKIKDKDIVTKTELREEDEFVLAYKSLIGYVLQEKYTYEDYSEGGMDLLKNNKKTATYEVCKTIEEIANLLKKEYEIELEDFYNNKIMVDKKRHNKSKMIIIISNVLLSITLIYGCYVSFITIPFKGKVINGSNAFLIQDYEKVIDSLDSIKADKLPKESKFVLAYSYIISESLAENLKKNILATISLKSDEMLLEFWINLGQEKYEEAIDISKRLGDDQLLAYALMKQKQYIINSDEITGEEKESKIDEIQSKIDEIEEKIKKISEESKTTGGSNG